MEEQADSVCDSQRIASQCMWQQMEGRGTGVLKFVGGASEQMGLVSI